MDFVLISDILTALGVLSTIVMVLVLVRRLMWNQDRKQTTKK